jgi:hypothetical protein
VEAFMDERPRPIPPPGIRTALHRIGRAPARVLAAGIALARIVRLARLSRLDAAAGDPFVEHRTAGTHGESSTSRRATVSAGVH